MIASSQKLAIDLGGRAPELEARGLEVVISDGKQRGAWGWIADGEREGLGIAAIGIGIADREEAQALAKTGTDRVGRTAGGVVEHWIANRTE